MLELIAIALLQLASFTASTEPKTDPNAANSVNPIVIMPTPGDAEQGGGGWGGGTI